MYILMGLWEFDLIEWTENILLKSMVMVGEYEEIVYFCLIFCCIIFDLESGILKQVKCCDCLILHHIASLLDIFMGI